MFSSTTQNPIERTATIFSQYRAYGVWPLGDVLGSSMIRTSAAGQQCATKKNSTNYCRALPLHIISAKNSKDIMSTEYRAGTDNGYSPVWQIRHFRFTRQEI